MEKVRFLECLAADEARLRDVAGRGLDAAVPSCPGWTVTDLVRHVAEVYLHKAECIRTGVKPSTWPPDLSGEEPLPLLDRAYAELVEQLASDPSSPAYTWYGPDQTVGFWVRRMAQETVIHRVDAELAAGEPVASIPADLAVDGIDEVLDLFLAYDTQEYSAEFGPALAESDGRTMAVHSGDARWSVRPTPAGVLVSRDVADEPGAFVDGDPQGVLLWLWGRVGDDAVKINGDEGLIDRVRELLKDATQ
jgi:uncharacterized protein (TIGR03083 family)